MSSDTSNRFFEDALGLLAFGLLVGVHVIATLFATFPTDFAWAHHAPLAVGVALVVLYGVLIQSWVIWAPFALHFLLSAGIILTKVIRYRGEQDREIWQ